MTLSDLGNLGELIGAVAVVLSLLYVAAQVRQNTRQVRASTFQGATRGWQEFLYAISSEDRHRIWRRGNAAPESLDGDEAVLYATIVRAYFRGYENDCYQHRTGTFEDGPWEGYRRSLRADGLRWPGIREQWRHTREGFDREFASFIDRELEATAADAPRGGTD